MSSYLSSFNKYMNTRAAGVEKKRQDMAEFRRQYPYIARPATEGQPAWAKSLGSFYKRHWGFFNPYASFFKGQASPYAHSGNPSSSRRFVRYPQRSHVQTTPLR